MLDVENVKKTLINKFKLITKKGRMVRKDFIDKKWAKKEEFMNSVLNDIEENHNHSWYEELYMRNIDNLDDIALFYRGNEITYEEMFRMMRVYAGVLQSNGITEGDEVPVCMSNTPEFVYLLGALSIIGAKINPFASDFLQDYILEIIRDCNSEIMFMEDNYFDDLKAVIEKSYIKKVVVTSLANSLDDNYEKYKKYDECHKNLFVDKTNQILSYSDKFISLNQFIQDSDGKICDVSGNVGLDSLLSVAYSSGTTSNRPKAIVHATRSFITIGRCHDPEIQKSASMKNFTIQSNAPTFSNTDLISNISDALMQGAKLALEPIYDGSGEFFIDSLLINEPTYVIATRSLWLKTFKKIENEKKYKNTKFRNLLVPFAVGEGIEPGEEKFINKGFRKTKAGTAVVKIPVSPVTISLAGGDCEHGGIFWQLYRSLASKTPGYVFRKEKAGMKAFEMVDYAILDKDGDYCKPYEFGRLVANSPCTMKEYKNNEEATRQFFIQDKTGKIWGDCCVYAYLDFKGKIHMKGRIPKDQDVIPPFKLTDVVARDTKNILSCETVVIDDAYVIHFELQPSCKKYIEQVMMSIEGRLNKYFDAETVSRVFYRIHSNEEGFATTHSGKRDLTLLANEGFDRAFKLVMVDDTLSFVDADYFMDDEGKLPKRLIKE